MLRRRGFTFIEMMISLVFIALLSVAIAASVRTTATDSAANAADSELLRALGKMQIAIDRDLRRAELASVTLNGAPDAEGGRPVLQFSYANGIDDEGALLAPTTVRFEVSGGAFRRVEVSSGEARSVAGFPSGVAGAPPLSFFIDAANRTVRYTIRASRAGDAAARSVQLRSREGAIYINN